MAKKHFTWPVSKKASANWYMDSDLSIVIRSAVGNRVYAPISGQYYLTDLLTNDELQQATGTGKTPESLEYDFINIVDGSHNDHKVSVSLTGVNVTKGADPVSGQIKQDTAIGGLVLGDNYLRMRVEVDGKPVDPLKASKQLGGIVYPEVSMKTPEGATVDDITTPEDESKKGSGFLGYLAATAVAAKLLKLF